MNEDFRQRVFIPLIMPLGVLVTFLAVAFSLSRVLLAVPEIVATFIALTIAGYILLIASLVSQRPNITSRALGAGLALGLMAVLASGVVAASAGMRELHHDEEGAAPAGEGHDAEGEAAGPPNTFVAVDIAFDAAPEELPAGEAEITLVNEGASLHTVVFDDLGDEPVLEAQPGETVSGTVDLPPGEHRYYCDVPGHEALMNGTLTAS